MAFIIYNLGGVVCKYRRCCLSVAGCENGSVEALSSGCAGASAESASRDVELPNDDVLARLLDQYGGYSFA